MLTVLRIHLPSDIPVVGCEITPYINIRKPDGSVTNEDFPESSPFNGCCFMRYKWYRNLLDQRFAVCSVHPTVQATLQCVVCLKEKAPVARSYHCSGKCFADAWQHHRVLHEQARKDSIEKGTDREEGHGRYSNPLAYPPPGAGTGEPWFEIGCSRTYTPTADDINHILKFECTIIHLVTRMPVGNASTTMTARVIPAPSPVPRHMVPVNGVDYMRQLESDGRVASLGTFSVLSYNILSDAFTTNEVYNYCPTWALSWSYRRQNLLREITGYHADILCLQEVQNDHFEEFLNPELEKHGYQAIYKKRTTEVYSGNPNSIDGCAVFFRKDVFSHVKKYEVEFNKAAQSVSEAVSQNSQNAALNRLIKDNVALIVVLEAKFSNNGTDSGKKQLVCVANTHVNVNHELKDVKLWQVHTLVKGLEKIAASADIPMLVCGDFNSVPGSAPHALLAMGKVDQMHPDLGTDPLNILRPLTKLNHQLPLVSAYSSFARLGMNPGLEQHKRRMDPATNEPLFTNYTRNFVGTLDYIFYTADSLTVESLLELLDGESLRKNTALPSPEWSSDHIALLAEFRCKPRIRR